jgi:CRP-like cAMP-binding protein
MIKYFAHELADLFNTGELLHYKKGEVILDPNDQSSYVYYIEEGYVKAYHLTEEGSSHLHVIFRPKKIFPLRGAILDLPGNSFYEAMTDITVRKLSKDTFLQALETNHSLAMIMLKKTTAVFDDYVTKVHNLQFTNTHARLISMLIHLAQSYSEEEDDKIILSIPLTHQELADLCNMARETVSRTLNDLHEKGIIETQNHRITINDMERLKEELTS